MEIVGEVVTGQMAALKMGVLGRHPESDCHELKPLPEPLAGGQLRANNMLPG